MGDLTLFFADKEVEELGYRAVFARRYGGKFPVLEGAWPPIGNERRCITPQHLGRVVLRIETDAEQVRFAIDVRRLHQRLFNLRKVMAHQRTIVGQRTARVDKRQQHRASTILAQVDALAVLVHEREIGDWPLPLGRLKLRPRGRALSIRFLHHNDIFQLYVVRGDHDVGGNLISGGEPIEISGIRGGVGHGHRSHESRNFLVIHDDALLRLVDGHNRALEMIASFLAGSVAAAGAGRNAQQPTLR